MLNSGEGDIPESQAMLSNDEVHKKIFLEERFDGVFFSLENIVMTKVAMPNLLAGSAL